MWEMGERPAESNGGRPFTFPGRKRIWFSFAKSSRNAINGTPDPPSFVVEYSQCISYNSIVSVPSNQQRRRRAVSEHDVSTSRVPATPNSLAKLRRGSNATAQATQNINCSEPQPCQPES